MHEAFMYVFSLKLTTKAAQFVLISMLNCVVPGQSCNFKSCVMQKYNNSYNSIMFNFQRVVYVMTPARI